MLETAGILGLKATGLIACGVCLGVGFYLSKKLTGSIDEKIAVHREVKTARMKKENQQYQEELTGEI